MSASFGLVWRNGWVDGNEKIDWVSNEWQQRAHLIAPIFIWQTANGDASLPSSEACEPKKSIEFSQIFMRTIYMPCDHASCHPLHSWEHMLQAVSDACCRMPHFADDRRHDTNDPFRWHLIKSFQLAQNDVRKANKTALMWRVRRCLLPIWNGFRCARNTINCLFGGMKCIRMWHDRRRHTETTSTRD